MSKSHTETAKRITTQTMVNDYGNPESKPYGKPTGNDKLIDRAKPHEKDR